MTLKPYRFPGQLCCTEKDCYKNKKNMDENCIICDEVSIELMNLEKKVIALFRPKKIKKSNK